MKVQYKVMPRVIIEADGESVKQVFERLAALAKVFACADACGCCGSKEIIPQVKEPQGFMYYELACLQCGAVFTFGQNKEGGGLFPKRDRGANGWDKYESAAA